MMRKTHVVARALVAGVALASTVVCAAGEAHACGGCFVPPPPPQQTESESIITDEKMILSISMNQTTLYDQINYSGSPSSFAWVLPIKGTVTVGLSADILFQTINQLTATEVLSPPVNCPPPPSCGGGGGAGCARSASASALTVPSGGASDFAEDAGAVVTVTSQKQVGPYETVQLHSTDGSALNQWLTLHGYAIPADTQTVIDAYVAQQFDFLALKLVPGEGVQSMQPVRVTSQGAAPTLPLHMVAVGTGATTGITIWIVADARWQPSNFPTFIITDSQLSWDWATTSSNYEAVRLAGEAALGGRGWQIESSLELAQYTISQSLQQNITYDSTGIAGGYLSPLSAPAVDAGPGSLLDGGAHDAGRSLSDASDAARGDALGFDAGENTGDDAGAEAGDEGDDGGDDGGGGGDGQLSAANADLAVLFAGVAQPNVRITRMRSDVAKAALSVDMILQAATDQSELTNQHTAQQEIGEPLCPIYNSSCVQTGTAPRSQAQAIASGGCSTTRPANGAGTTVAFLLGVFGLTAMRLRRNRARRS